MTPKDNQRAEWLKLAKFYQKEYGVPADFVMQLAELAFKDGVICALENQLDKV